MRGCCEPNSHPRNNPSPTIHLRQDYGGWSPLSRKGRGLETQWHRKSSTSPNPSALRAPPRQAGRMKVISLLPLREKVPSEALAQEGG